jgi:dTDP-4-dehydrorhamnose reductase
MKILLLGSKGRLGSAFKYFFIKNKIKYLSVDNKKFFTSQKKIRDLMCKKLNNKTDIILNCTALTDVNLCNNNFKKAYDVNAKVLENIVDSLTVLNINPVLVHFSTDQMYSQKRQKKSNEKDINPSNFYAISKYLGELKVAKLKKHIIIRTNFFGTSHNKTKITYSDYLIKNLKKKILKIPKNIFFNPILIDDLVLNTYLLIKKNFYGTYNIGSSTYMSKYEFALTLAKIKKLPIKNILPYNSIPSKHNRPLFTVMNTLKFSKKTKIKLPKLIDCIKRI